jgi:ADP-dependent NAD(P)H-hydrate dehydratase
MIGAPALCARAALRSGAGLVKVAVPASILQAVVVIEPGATGIALDDDADTTMRFLAQGDHVERAVLAVGPGWGVENGRMALLKLVLIGSRTVVLDADGLNLLAETARPRPRRGPPLILTPHPGEFRRLAGAIGVRGDPTDEQQRPTAAAELADMHDAVVVLKGHRSIVTDGRRCYVNGTGNAALATAGSGDVLTGVIAALCAQGMEPFEAAVLATHLHGLGADLWKQQNGAVGLRAMELADRLPAAIREHGRG